MTPSRALVSLEPAFLKRIGEAKKRIVRKEVRLTSLITDLVSVRASIDEFHEKEYWPKLGRYRGELDRLRDELLGKTGHSPEEPPGRESCRAPAKAADEPAAGKELKEVYRKLAKLYHPDGTSDPDEKVFRHARMAAINAAFSERDLRALRRILDHAGAEVGAAPRTVEERLHELEIDEEVLAELLKVYARRLEDQKKSPAFRLMGEVRRGAARGVDILAELAAGVRERISIYRGLFGTATP